ncbi:hypothetical protein JQ554_30490 [Bradyrhizobium diazoefficiens]|nr:hypothetical protein [Bradyrhizobium diazoefficiens]MBR0968502.1 hypothetical protein [Bradyrhizobium diazoefficiens]MBR0981826.1 hypothetical protein [Bradyrhizobium diazoefficiens]MBR1011277.1 hypothetical protein [Bradyrhizobium diazoefficiens]MBR1015744.1 hypothetical protein [Bradyrhizobium diazoefficiens]MBR1055117.1 hypothetical protein [Bradyrhizobium diazoefficiens]
MEDSLKIIADLLSSTKGVIVAAAALATTIGAFFAWLGGVFGWLKNQFRSKALEARPRTPDVKPEVLVQSGVENSSVKGHWISLTEGQDEIHITDLQGVRVRGVRYYTPRGRSRRQYEVAGFFDGDIISLAALDLQEQRCVSIFVKREGNGRLVGTRTSFNQTARKIRCTENVEWRRLK